MRSFSLFILAGILSVACTKQENLTQYVDPFIGTGGHGHTYPGATVPFGMVQLSPDNGHGGWDWCSGYHYTDSVIIGFSHTHLSGTGIGDMLDITLQPTVVNAVSDTTKGGSEFLAQFLSPFSHKDEKASPGYYSVVLKKGDIKVELTTAPRAGFHKYTFPAGVAPQVVLDLGHAVNWDNPAETKIAVMNNTTLQGYRFSHGWAANEWVFFTAEFSRPFHKVELVKDGQITGEGKEVLSKRSSALISFEPGNEPLLVKVGISSASEEGSALNLRTEIPEWNFDKTLKNAVTAWNHELGKVKATSADKDELTVFYSALYHSMLAPTLYSDVDGQYRGLDGKIHKAVGFDNYYTFSLWDTFRGEHPLFTILQPERTADFVNAMLAHYMESPDSLLPVWSLWGNETWCMIGYHSVPVIADAIMKGIPGFDVNLAYAAMKKTGMQNIRNTDLYKKYGYIPYDSVMARTHGESNESASSTLEYGYDDWCIAQVAKKLGKTGDYDYFTKRSRAYELLFDPETRLIRPRNANGSWLTPFYPNKAQFKNGFTEGNSWQYSWFVPHDIPGLMEKMGGPEVFASRLDTLFEQPSTGSEFIDVSGVIGQYAQGNEPSHHVAYLYNYAGKPEKTQRILTEIVDSLYTTGPNGLCGNDDCGQMSAWYVLTALGFYPVNASSGEFDLGRPFVQGAMLNLENGKKFSIETRNFSKDNMLVKKVTLNGNEVKNYKISYSDIMQGGTLVFEMGK